ncbi:MAG: hypothetical protein MZV65_10970 [Chromatiales bacterium]|nr:hypothetical protein [Chromatiales bacterium]
MTGSGETYGTGAVLSARSADGDWRLNLNASGWDQDGTEITAGPDRLYTLGLGELSQSPGRINNAENHRLAVLALDYKKLSVLAQYSRSQGGTFFGPLNVLPETSTGRGRLPGRAEPDSRCAGPSIRRRRSVP